VYSLSLTQIVIASASQNSLLCLRQWNCSVTVSALVNLVKGFPNLAHFGPNDFFRKSDDQPIPPPERLLKILSVTGFCADGCLNPLDPLLGLSQVAGTL